MTGNKSKWLTAERKYDLVIIIMGIFIGMIIQTPQLNDYSFLSIVVSAALITGVIFYVGKWINNREDIIKELKQ